MKGILEIVALNKVKLVEIFFETKKMMFFSYIWDQRVYNTYMSIFKVL